MSWISLLGINMEANTLEKDDAEPMKIKISSGTLTSNTNKKSY